MEHLFPATLAFPLSTKTIGQHVAEPCVGRDTDRYTPAGGEPSWPSASFTYQLGRRRWATSITPHSTPSDPAEAEAMKCLEQGTQKLEENDLQGAKQLYKRSVEIKRNASSLFNLGVTHYHLKEFDEAIAAWQESIRLQPDSPDAHTNLASAIAASLAPKDPEISFNLAAVLEATGQLEEALTYYKHAKEHGVERAAMHIRNVSAKILGKTIKKAQEEQPEGPKKPES
ncbi:hypothetical protein SCLCIDRAFT_29537 [Scleroderma citrinum Foug A]|uniref:MalT-like TPR region domain-containing protein n=1 Tax=Scleroderma citrinum Foug A TaxID=1036808 RepID=A0A0C2Z3J8_9AGAM|nr:hypothetical protein SCLCIDRAFT_29537 [Scleroderma citrinum Foug A]